MIPCNGSGRNEQRRQSQENQCIDLTPTKRASRTKQNRTDRPRHPPEKVSSFNPDRKGRKQCCKAANPSLAGIPGDKKARICRTYVLHIYFV